MKNKSIWYNDYIRTTDDSYRHYNWLKGIYETKKNKDCQRYYNVGYKGVQR